jgi:mono/diheme cytochrome c family protein
MVIRNLLQEACMKKIAVCLLVMSLALLMLSTQSFSAGESEQGRIVYEAFCTSCHGANGGGDGPEAAGLNPAPMNLTDSAVTADLTSQDIERAVIMGKTDTAMKGFGGLLTKEDMENLFAYLSALTGK